MHLHNLKSMGKTIVRKTAMTAIVIVVVPTAVVATAIVASVAVVDESARTLLRGASTGIKAIREV